MIPNSQQGRDDHGFRFALILIPLLNEIVKLAFENIKCNISL